MWYKFCQQSEPIVIVGKYQIKDAGNQWEIFKTNSGEGEAPAATYQKSQYPTIDKCSDKFTATSSTK